MFFSFKEKSFYNKKTDVTSRFKGVGRQASMRQRFVPHRLENVRFASLLLRGQRGIKTKLKAERIGKQDPW